MARMRRALSVASECVPLVKTGGLADVVGALPGALASFGWQVRTLLPAYPGVLDRVGRTTRVWHDPDLFGGPASVRRARFAGLDLLLLDAPHLYDRPGGPYGAERGDHPDNHVRFAALSWVASRIAIEGCGDRWRPEIVHAHDWQAGLVPSYLKYAESRVPVAFTIHNIAFQGVCSPAELDRLRLPTWDFHPEALEYHGLLSTLKAGMVHATHVTTVSPTYAAELTRGEFGFGLEGVVAARLHRGEMTGILNGIDTTWWDPASDPHVIPFSADDPAAKAENRRLLLEEFALAEPTGPVAVVVTRLTHQKGIDLLLATLGDFVEAGGAVAVLGSGDPGYEQGFVELAERFRHAVGIRLGYDEPLSHRMYAGADLVLVPSRFEPCGLTQMYGMRYGAAPVVADTGGLRDTVTDQVTGFTFHPGDAAALADALRRASTVFADGAAFAALQHRAMREHHGWEQSARRYAELFTDLAR